MALTRWFVRITYVNGADLIPSLLSPTDSWGGALLFVAFLAEMRHPMDFWKGLLCAQIFICCVYIFFGVFVSHLSFVGMVQAQTMIETYHKF